MPCTRLLLTQGNATNPVNNDCDKLVLAGVPLLDTLKATISCKLSVETLNSMFGTLFYSTYFFPIDNQANGSTTVIYSTMGSKLIIACYRE